MHEFAVIVVGSVAVAVLVRRSRRQTVVHIIVVIVVLTILSVIHVVRVGVVVMHVVDHEFTV